MYDRANVNLIRNSISRFPWEEHFRENQDVNWQVQSFNEKILNIMSNFIPNKTIKVIPREPPWIDKALKNMLNRQQRLYRNYKKHGFKPDDKSRVDVFRSKFNMAIKKAKEGYLKKLGDKLADPKLAKRVTGR